MTERHGHMLDHEDALLVMIGEYEDAEYLEDGTVDEVLEVHVKAAKAKTETLAAAAEKEMMDLSSLLGKLKTGTATRDEKVRLKSLHWKDQRSEEGDGEIQTPGVRNGDDDAPICHEKEDYGPEKSYQREGGSECNTFGSRRRKRPPSLCRRLHRIDARPCQCGKTQHMRDHLSNLSHQRQS